MGLPRSTCPGSTSTSEGCLRRHRSLDQEESLSIERPQLAICTENHIGISCYTPAPYLALPALAHRLPVFTLRPLHLHLQQQQQQLFVLRLSRFPPFYLLACWESSNRIRNRNRNGIRTTPLRRISILFFSCLHSFGEWVGMRWLGRRGEGRV